MKEIEAIEDKLQAGDIIFIRVANFLYKRVADATLSWTSHVGMIYGKVNGVWIVAESAVPFSKKGPLIDFIARSENSLFSVKRLKGGLTEVQQQTLQNAADLKMRQLYHLGFNLDSKLQYCSKFVYEVYKDALGIEIGKVETVSDLLSKNPKTPLNFWRLWYLGKIPWTRRMVSPASQYESDKLQLVYENLK